MSRSGDQDPATRIVVAGLHGIALVLLFLHWTVRTLPPTTEAIPPPESAEAAWWGLWPIAYLPAPAFWIGVVIVLGLVEWAWLPEAWSLRLPRWAARARVWLIAPSLLLVVAFYAWPIVHTRWGDAYLLSRAIAWPDPAVRLTHSWQAPLDVFLHSRVWLALHDRFGWEDAIAVYRLLSPLAGVLYLVGVVGLSLDLRRKPAAIPAWLTYLLLVSLGVIQLFFGYVENYSFAAAGIVLFLWLGQRTMAGRAPLWLPALVLALTNATHPSTVVLAPALLYVGWRVAQRDPVGGTNAPAASVLSRVWHSLPAVALAIALPMVLVAGGTILLMEAGGHGLAALLTSDRPGGGDASWFVPLWATRTRWEAYTLLSWAHLRDLLNQQALVAPVVLPSLAWLALWRGVIRRRYVGGQATQGQAAQVQQVMQADPHRSVRIFWQIAAVCHLLLIVVWNPDYGGQRDWDLFSLASIATTLWLVASLRRDEADDAWLVRGFAPLVALQLWHTAAWIYQNTLPWSWP